MQNNSNYLPDLEIAFLAPVVAGQSDNTGAQALAVVMLGLALREMRTKQWKKTVFKEAVVGFFSFLGLAMIFSSFL